MKLSRSAGLALLSVISLVATTDGVAAAPETAKGVVVLYSFRHGLSGHDLGENTGQVLRDVRAVLDASTSSDTPLHIEYLDASDLPESIYFQQVADDLRDAYSGVSVSAVLAVNFRALDFLTRHGETVFPGSAIVFSNVEKRRLDDLEIGANVTGVVQEATIGETTAATLRMLPDTERVFVIVGTSETDRFVERVARLELEPFEGWIDVMFPEDRSISGLLDQVANLPEHSFVLFLTLVESGSTDGAVPTNVVSLLAAASSAPTFGILDAFLGSGIVGGDLASLEVKSQNAITQVGRILDGERPADIPVVESMTARLMFDARQLERWGIPEDNLPPGSLVQFKELSIWAAYKWRIIGVLVLLVGQSFLIGALLLNRAKRRNAERSLQARLRFESLVSKLSVSLKYAGASELDERIEYWLPRVGEASSADRCALLVCAGVEDESRVLQSWTADALTPSLLRSYEKERPWCHAKLVAGETIRLDRLLDRLGGLPQEAEDDARSFTEDGVKSHLAVPILIGDTTCGALTFDHVSEETAWSDAMVGRARLVGELFAEALGRRQGELQLQSAFTEIARLEEQLKLENSFLRKQPALERRYDQIVGESEAIKKCLSEVEMVADTESTILLLGETGTGKDLLASTIHQLSRRSNRAMIKLNCAALPPGLIESELFGREAGAYTGATTRQEGRFEAANGSTILLDEVGELPLDLQAKLLRVLQDGEFERLGSPKPVHVDVRVIAATNRDLADAVRRKQFREDLYYRLNVFPITVPPLRERKEDIPLLVWAFVDEFAKRAGKTITSIRERDMEAFRRYPWAGNIRELRNVIERAVITSTGPNLDIVPQAVASPETKSLLLDDVERRHILDVFELTEWRVRGAHGAAEILGLKPSTLESRMAKLGIRRPPRSEIA